MDWEALLKEGLRAGLGVEEFWRLTPRETYAAIEARAWQMEREGERAAELVRIARRLAGWLAWHTAALQRSKRMPPLQRLIGGGETRKLTPEQARERKARFEELKKLTSNRRGRRGRKEGTENGDGRDPRDSSDSGAGGAGQAGRGPGGGAEEN